MNTFIFDSMDAWAGALASLWRDRLHMNPRLCHCLPAGNTPKPVFAAMVESVRRGHVSFRDSTVFLLDEYGGLVPDDPGRCVNQLRQALIRHIDLPADRFHYLDPDDARLDEACRVFDAAVAGGLDLTLLGLGLNGHLGLNEPGSALDSGTRRVEMHPASVGASAGYLNHGRLPTWGVTLGLKPLLASKEVWLIATGRAKAGIIRRVVRGPVDVAVPASWLRQHPNCTLFLDAEAASELG